MGNFIDLGESPFSKKVINVDQQRTWREREVKMKKKKLKTLKTIKVKYL